MACILNQILQIWAVNSKCSMPSVNASLVRDVAMCNQPLKTKGSATVVADENKETLPLDLLLILDCSGSMKGQGISVVTESTLHILNDLLGPDDRIAVITFSNGASLHCNWTSKSGTVPPFSAGGGTNFGSAIKEALSLLGGYDAAGSRAGMALFLSDGHAGQKASDTNVSSIPQFGFTMHTIGVTSGANPTHLEHMAELARGHYFDAPTFADVKQAFASIFNYGKTVIYAAPELEIEVMDGVELTNMIQSPQGIKLSDKMGPGTHSVSLTHMLKNTRMEIAYDVEVGNIPCEVMELASFSFAGAKSMLKVRGTDVETDLYNAPVNNDVTLITTTAKAATAIKTGDQAAATRAITKLKTLEKTVPNATTRTETLTEAQNANSIGAKLETLGRIQATPDGKTVTRED